MRRVPTHYLRPNEREWSPRHVGFVDTETYVRTQTTREVHTLRLWCAWAYRRDLPTSGQCPTARQHGFDRASLADWVEQQLVGQRSMWLYAHNLSFDLTVTRLLTVLHQRGWQLSDLGVTDRNPWFRLRRDSKTLCLLDSWSWLPTKLAAIGGLVGVKKPPLPTWDDDHAAWLERCYGDVDVTAAAILALMTWWDEHRLGNWTITGASTGWNAMRHMESTGKMLIDPDRTPATPTKPHMGPRRPSWRPTDQRAPTFERRAVRGGRRDVWRLGRFAEGPYAQLDIERAHCSVVEHLPMPWRRLGPVKSFALDDQRWGRPTFGLIAWARVRCTEPRWPVKIGGYTWWPVGEMWTVLAMPELREARARGELLEVGPGWRYLVGDQLAGWARWCNAVASGAEPHTPAVAELAAKHWGRSVVGKWAAHTSEAVSVGTALSAGWSAEKAIVADSRCRATIVDIMGERRWVEHEHDADEAFPAVLAWVESELRVRMASVIDILGPGVVCSVDTDGVVIDLGAARDVAAAARWPANRKRTPWTLAAGLCDHLAEVVAPLTIVPKATYPDIEIKGPQQLMLGPERKFSGVPRSAVDAGDGAYRARTWPKMRWQMAHGDEAGYVRPEVVYRPRGNYARRWVTGSGRVVPVMATTGPTRTTTILPWDQSWSDQYTNPDPDFQHPGLNGLC